MFKIAIAKKSEFIYFYLLALTNRYVFNSNTPLKNFFSIFL